MSSGQLMVVLIVLIVSVTSLLKSGRLRHRDRGGRGAIQDLMGDSAPALPSLREAELQREVEELRERVHVLERIATEERHSREIAAEIESLRGK